ncbi:hypothetical protein EYC84_010814 [Monilinia fructicola]|uniref:Uncharacterized protein n=1 Tax=Monilinia fructicola TaxID=38448 RepID=A0A5M9JB05_MONFR|nr:hypothetical protein EYC84_010814 [Monilinia fructicola]
MIDTVTIHEHTSHTLCICWDSTRERALSISTYPLLPTKLSMPPNPNRADRISKPKRSKPKKGMRVEVGKAAIQVNQGNKQGLCTLCFHLLQLPLPPLYYAPPPSKIQNNQDYEKFTSACTDGVGLRAGERMAVGKIKRRPAQEQ